MAKVWGGLGNVRKLGRWTTRRLAGVAGALDLVPLVAENLKCDWSKLRCAVCKIQSRFLKIQQKQRKQKTSLIFLYCLPVEVILFGMH